MIHMREFAGVAGAAPRRMLADMESSPPSSVRTARQGPRALALACLLTAMVTLTASVHPAAVYSAEVSPPARSANGWAWPVAADAEVVRPFDAPDQPWLSGHRGIDVAAGAGARVHSPAAGTVAFAGWVVNRPVITITHPDGRRSSFEPVDSQLPVGARVSRGEPIGTVTRPWHCTTFPCLHWGVREGERYVNPLQFVTGMQPSVLLPLPPETS